MSRPEVAVAAQRQTLPSLNIAFTQILVDICMYDQNV